MKITIQVIAVTITSTTAPTTVPTM